MQRIYLPNTTFSEILILSDTEIYHQLTRVMRARVGQKVVFFDGEKLIDHQYEITSIDKKQVVFQMDVQKEKDSEIIPEMTLYQALPNKLSKLEYIIQKCSEIGYRKIIFFVSERSQKLVLSENKKQRLEKIAIEAIEQCGGNIVPQIQYVESLSNVPVGDNTLLCHTKSEDSSWLTEITTGSVLEIIIGPEWWLSEEEVGNCIARWAKKIYFWNRILRCETVWEVVWFFLSQKKES